MSPTVAGVIPARFASTRFPGKMLAPVGGVPMVIAVARQAQKARSLHRVLVATDHPGIAEVCERHGVEWRMTAADHPSGTDRLAEAARKLKDVSYLINVQGDEPLIDPGLINAVVKTVIAHPEAVASACCPLADEKEWRNPNAVKTLLRKDGRAITFSRAPIPYPRTGDPLKLAYKHIGIYGYEKRLLLWYARQQPALLEETECLEQLRLLVLGKDLRMVKTAYRPIGVDTPADLKKVNRILAEKRP